MEGEKDLTPGVAEVVLILFVVSLTFEEINQVTINYCFRKFSII